MVNPGLSSVGGMYVFTLCHQVTTSTTVHNTMLHRCNVTRPEVDPHSAAQHSWDKVNEQVTPVAWHKY